MDHTDISEREIQKMLKVADIENHGYLTFPQFLRIIADQKSKPNFHSEEETLEAFVAMGGEENGEGFVDAELLIKIIKKDFEMTIDIEDMIN
jgi:calmodulin